MLQEKLVQTLSKINKIAVAFSGGVDSSMLARAAKEARGIGNVILLTAAGPTFSQSQRQTAEEQAQQIGLPHFFVTTSETSLPEFVANGPERCYYCKKYLFSELSEAAELHLPGALLIEGSNVDDLSDYRPGMRALEEMGIRSPLVECGIRKEEVRELARQWELTTAEQPPSPCLASRIVNGVEITKERLERIEKAEKVLRQFVSGPLRVRLHNDELARIEVTEEEIVKLTNKDARATINKELMSLGFRFVSLDLEPHQQGKLNRLIPLAQKIEE